MSTPPKQGAHVLVVKLLRKCSTFDHQMLPAGAYSGPGAVQLDAKDVSPPPQLARKRSLMASLFPKSSKDLTSRAEAGPKRFTPFAEGVVVSFCCPSVLMPSCDRASQLRWAVAGQSVGANHSGNPAVAFPF